MLKKLFPKTRIGWFSLVSMLSLALNALLTLIQRPELSFMVGVICTCINVPIFFLIGVLREIRYLLIKMSRRHILSVFSFAASLTLIALYLFWDKTNSVTLLVGLGILALSLYFNFLAPYLLERERIKEKKRALQYAGTQ